MSVGLSLEDPVWSYLYEGKVKKMKLPDLPNYLWPWLQQVYSLPKENLDLLDPLAPVYHFELRNGEYWISFRPSKNFPIDPPIYKCAYQLAFVSEWNNNEAECCLAAIRDDYRKYCEEIDECIGIIRDIENVPGCSLVGYGLNEDNNECFDVKLKLESENQSHNVELTIDWRNPQEFPNTLCLGTFGKTREIECTEWDSSLSLADNLANIFQLGAPRLLLVSIHVFFVFFSFVDSL
ncbi:unnamed protein product [Auanema sp. JU1783]|nr:unnamed protein product [Auanema sp. JU1783]